MPQQAVVKDFLFIRFPSVSSFGTAIPPMEPFSHSETQFTGEIVQDSLPPVKPKMKPKGIARVPHHTPSIRENVERNPTRPVRASARQMPRLPLQWTAVPAKVDRRAPQTKTFREQADPVLLQPLANAP
jgi:hypothetical protein